jgi:hypothetical protein
VTLTMPPTGARHGLPSQGISQSKENQTMKGMGVE